MKDQETEALKSTVAPSEIDVGLPVEWMVDPDRPDIVLGITYEFSLTGERRTVWYTPNKRRTKTYVVVFGLADG